MSSKNKNHQSSSNKPAPTPTPVPARTDPEVASAKSELSAIQKEISSAKEQLMSTKKEEGAAATRLENLKETFSARQEEQEETFRKRQEKQEETFSTRQEELEKTSSARQQALGESIRTLEARQKALQGDVRVAQGEYDLLLKRWNAMQSEVEALPEQQAKLDADTRALQQREKEALRQRQVLEHREKLLLKREEALAKGEDALNTRTSEQAEAAAKRTQNLNEEHLRLIAQRAAQDPLERQLDARRKDLEAREAAASAAVLENEARLLMWEAALRALEHDLKARELNAEADFARQNREALERLDAEARDLHDRLSEARAQLAGARADQGQELDAHRERLKRERAAWDAELQEAHQTLTRLMETTLLSCEQTRIKADDELQKALNRRREAAEAAAAALLQKAEVQAQALLKEAQARLDEQWKELNQAQSVLKAERCEHQTRVSHLKAEQSVLEEDREELEALITHRAAHDVSQLEQKKQTLEMVHARACARRDALEKTLAAREEADRRFGHQSPDEVLAQLESSRKEIQKLQKDLQQRLSSEQSGRLETLEAEQVQWAADRQDLERQRAELERKLNLIRTSSTELEGIRLHRESLEATNKLLVAANEELQSKVQELTTKAEGQPIFPACVALDKDEQNKGQPQTLTLVVKDPSLRDEPQLKGLEALVPWLQQRLAKPSAMEHGNRPLHYSLSDLRSFLGGMAMSRLHLLQGISGTGKTSLPVSVARILGGGCEIIPVQAGWRDRQDLLGHYNTFERRYLETPFLQALYKAQTHAWSNRPFFIVLDELNLSRPEQYFADLISLLELPEEKRRLELLSQAIEPSPKHMVDGRLLRLPKNVWFIGTANHDETTNELADKTYDRSHVMELPRHREEVKVSVDPVEHAPLSLESLEHAFRLAQQRQKDSARTALSWLVTHLQRPLEQHFRLGWGNRLERQAKAYIPVVIESGGSMEEALDHLLATRILRRTCNRHDVRAVAYSQLKAALEKGWKAEGLKSPATKSLQLLENELARLNADRIEEEQS